MNYLGKKSLSSALYYFSHIAKYGVALGGAFVSVTLSIAMFAQPRLTPGEGVWETLKYKLFSKIIADDKANATIESWNFFTSSPLAHRVLALIAVLIIIGLLLYITYLSSLIFNNFKNNVVFHDDNVGLISRLSKVLIVYSALTLSFALFLVSIIFLILADVFKNGSFLQKDYDLTI